MLPPFLLMSLGRRMQIEAIGVSRLVQFMFMHKFKVHLTPLWLASLIHHVTKIITSDLESRAGFATILFML